MQHADDDDFIASDVVKDVVGAIGAKPNGWSTSWRSRDANGHAVMKLNSPSIAIR